MLSPISDWNFTYPISTRRVRLVTTDSVDPEALRRRPLRRRQSIWEQKPLCPDLVVEGCESGQRKEGIWRHLQEMCSPEHAISSS